MRKLNVCLFGMFVITFTLIHFSKLVTTSEININGDNKVLGWDYSEYEHQNEHRSSEILSRKRRYLTFPSGSSFQLVYDLIVGVVDYTNYLILGITSALAWQLPSEPPSEIIDNLRDQLNDGTFGTSRNDTIENIHYVDAKPEYTQKPAYITSNTNPSYGKPQSYQTSYYTSNQFHPPMNTKYYSSKPAYYSQKGNGIERKQDMKYYSTRQNPLTEWKERRVSSPSSAPNESSTFGSKWSQWLNKKPTEEFISKKPQYIRKHRIFPVFAKRSVDKHNRQKRHGIEGTSLTKIDKIHLRFHRSTRQEIYHKVEKYLEIHNKNGQECVLKALCETGKKNRDDEPGTFVGEIMRSIFTIPESEDPVHHYKHKMYDEAHAHDGDCIEKYPLCADSVWKADFVL